MAKFKPSAIFAASLVNNKEANKEKPKIKKKPKTSFQTWKMAE